MSDGVRGPFGRDARSVSAPADAKLLRGLADGHYVAERVLELGCRGVEDRGVAELGMTLLALGRLVTARVALRHWIEGGGGALASTGRPHKHVALHMHVRGKFGLEAPQSCDSEVTRACKMDLRVSQGSCSDGAARLLETGTIAI